MAKKQSESLQDAAMKAKRKKVFQDAVRQHNELVVRAATEALGGLHRGRLPPSYAEDVLEDYKKRVREGALLAIVEFLGSRGTLEMFDHSFFNRRQQALATGRKATAAARDEVIASVIREAPAATWKTVVKSLTQRRLARVLDNGALEVEGHAANPIADASLPATIGRIKRAVRAAQ